MAISTRPAPPRHGVQVTGHGGGPKRRASARRFNWLGGSMGWVWLIVVMVPIYWIVITSFKTRANYYAQNPLVPPSSPTLDNYRLVIEADGGQHSQEADARRDAYIRSQDFRILRFWNDEIFNNEDGVITAILDALSTPLPNPSPARGEWLRSGRRA